MVSVPVHITLPSGLRKRCLSCSGRNSHRNHGTVVSRIGVAANPERDRDSKLGIDEDIRRFASRRSRAFKMRARERARCQYHSAAIGIKEEVVSNHEEDVDRTLMSPFGSMKVSIPRCLIRNSVLAMKRRRTSSASRSLTSSESDGSDTGSLESSVYGGFDLDNDVESRCRIPKIFRRRLSDSSWSSAM